MAESNLTISVATPEVLHAIVMKLIGPVNPVGETHIDDRRFENLQILTGLTEKLMADIDRIADENKNSQQFSVQRAGRHCDQFLDKMGVRE